MCSLFSLIEQPTNIYLHGHNGLELFPADQRPQPWYTLDNLDNSKSNTYRQLSTLIHSFSFYSLSFTSRKGLEAALGMRQALDNKHSHSHLFTMGNLESLLHLYMAREDMQSPHRETSIGGRHQDRSIPFAVRQRCDPTPAQVHTEIQPAKKSHYTNHFHCAIMYPQFIL